MGSQKYRVIESQSDKVGALSAGASERSTITEPTYARKNRGHVLWNSLRFINRDASVALSLRLDGLTSGAKVFDIPAGGSVTVEPEDGITFEYAHFVNLDGSTASTANSATLDVFYKEEV